MMEVSTTRKAISYFVTFMLLYFCKYSYDASQKSLQQVLPPVIAPTQTESPMINSFPVKSEYSADAEVHVIGIFEGECTQPDAKACSKEYTQTPPPKRPVTVNITASNHPVILVLMSHGSVQWHLNVGNAVKLEQIILGGFYAQEVTGMENHIPVAVYTHDPSPCVAACIRGEGFFESYRPQNGIIDKISEITGKSISTFQGSYTGRSFNVTDNTPKLEMPMPPQNE